jgi:hypothetical protein
VADNFAKSWDMLRLEILHQRNVRYVSFFGGEPLVHPHLADMIKMTVAKGMGPAVITNGWLLPAKLDQLAAAGLKTVYVSIDAAARWHRRFAILASRLSAFSYPQRARLGSSSLAWSDDSKLVQFTDQELLEAFEAVDALADRRNVASIGAIVGNARAIVRLARLGESPGARAHKTSPTSPAPKVEEGRRLAAMSRASSHLSRTAAVKYPSSRS